MGLRHRAANRRVPQAGNRPAGGQPAASHSKRVLTPAQRARLSVEFSLDALLRASLKDRMDLYAKAVQNGLKTRNECRQLENDPPVTGGDQLTAQTNLAPLEMLGKIQGGGNAAQKTLSLSDCQIKLDGDGGKFAGYASVLAAQIATATRSCAVRLNQLCVTTASPRCFTATSGISPSASGSKQKRRSRPVC